MQSFEGVELAGKASTGVDALEQSRLLKPDLILMDLRMPDMDGVEATKRIKVAQPTIKVVALTALEDPLQITRALEEGMDGFLLKRASPRELKLAIESVIAGEQYLSPQVSAIIAKAYLDERSRKHARHRFQSGIPSRLFKGGAHTLSIRHPQRHPQPFYPVTFVLNGY